MRSWRARRYVVDLHRRHRVTITVRRFRLAARPNKPASRTRRWTLDIRLGRIRQIGVEYKPLGRRSARQPNWRWQSALASLFIIIGICGITLSVSALAQPKSLDTPKSFTAAPAARPAPKAPLSLAPSIPTHITIPSQNIDVDLMSVGIAQDGSIELPPVLEWIAGWYKYSPTPGEIGPAVIVGHVDSYEDISVFWQLRYVQAGDTIDVSREDGSVAHFQVTQLASYDQHTFPTETVYGNTADAQLRVITCGGTFDTATGHYTENTVVFAKLVS